MAHASITKELAHVLLDTTDPSTGSASSPQAGSGQAAMSETEINTFLKSFAAYLAQHGLIKLQDEIIDEYRKLYNEKHNIVEATVTLVSRLPEATRLDLREALKKKYQASEVHILEKVDHRILGGIKIKVGDEVTDLSIQNSLSQLQAQLLK